MKRRRRLRKLVPDAELIRRRAAGEPLRELASDYDDVAHTTLGHYFKRPEVAKQLRAEREQARRARAAARELTSRRRRARSDYEALARAAVQSLRRGFNASMPQCRAGTRERAGGTLEPAGLYASLNDLRPDVRALSPGRPETIGFDRDILRYSGSPLRELASDYDVAHGAFMVR